MLVEPIANVIKQIWNLRSRILLGLIAGSVLAAFAVLGNIPGAIPAWMGFGEYQKPNGEVERAKTLWDWMSLLLVPVALAIGVWALNRADRAIEQRSLVASQAEEALHRYLDRMSSLILDKGLTDSVAGSSVQSIARATTLATLKMLDARRKGIVLSFLCEAKLVNLEPILRLKAADLSEANLSKLNLSSVNLSIVNLSRANLGWANLNLVNLRGSHLEWADLRSASMISANLERAVCTHAQLRRATLASANLDAVDMRQADLTSALLASAHMPNSDLRSATLRRANLSEANLTAANLFRADLRHADLRGAKLTGADLRYADLRGANLDNSDLSFADLSGARIQDEQLIHAKSLEIARLPNGSLHHGGTHA